jgi:hypothetical protein
MSEADDNVNDQENSDQPSQSVVDIEDSAGRAQSQTTGPRATVSLKRKRDQAGLDSQGTQGSDLSQNWRDALGPPPPMGKTKVSNVFADLCIFRKKISLRFFRFLQLVLNCNYLLWNFVFFNFTLCVLIRGIWSV